MDDATPCGSVLALNAGSSSLKFALFDAAGGGPARARGEVANLESAPHFTARDADGTVLVERQGPTGRADAFADALEALLGFAEAHLDGQGLAAVGHRIVHGGPRHMAPAAVTPALLDALDGLVPFDPLHMPHNIAPIRAVALARPGIPQVVCFDTAFHATLPPEARSFGLPRALEAEGFRRYGFHGLSYDFIAGSLAAHAPALARGRVVVAHLGSGASLCALNAGRSIATTMGFSTLDGLVMATRCGSIDPGVIFGLARQGRSLADIEDMLYHRSGLLGVSGIGGDIRDLLASADPHAAEAVALFGYRVARETGALAACLGGLDGFVFTAGIGEHAPSIRADICGRLAWLGLRLDPIANAAGASSIAAPDSTVDIRVIPTDEESVIARQTRATLWDA